MNEECWLGNETVCSHEYCADIQSREDPREIASANERLYEICQAYREVTISVKLIFVSDQEWSVLVDSQLELESETWRNEAYKDYVRNEARGFEIDGVIFIKKSAQKASDFRRLLLHELGHAVCDLNHVNRDGDIMNSNWRKWYGCGEVNG